MDIFHGSWSEFMDVRDSVVTVGFFDGLHLGHQAILDHVIAAARAQSLRSVVLTFAQHPREVLSDGANHIAQLTTPEEKIELLRDSALDLTMVVDFDHGLSQMSAADFVQIVLKGRIGMRKIVIGYNHGFGKQRLGDRETLIAMSKNLGFSVDVVNPERISDTIVSSTAIRELISDGQVARAAERLGRHYSVRGTVVHGCGRGRRLQWPTANLGDISEKKLLPRDGIYAGLVRLHGDSFPAAISCGFNPTFSEGRHSLEAYILDFDREIYGTTIELAFVDRIRSEKKFTSEEELTAQIAEDVGTVKAMLRTRGLLRQHP